MLWVLIRIASPMRPTAPPTAYVYREEMWDIIDTNTIKYPPFLWGKEFSPLLWKKFFLSDISICVNGVVFSKALC